ncbi:sensor histidine kinase [Actinomadura sp. J1-007]|nr:sensor histidine kinase [Actinomadura sp. J1-007]
MIMLMLAVTGNRAGSGGAAPAEIAITVATWLPLAVRRLWPRPVCAAVLAMTAVSVIAGLPPEALGAAAYAVYPVALDVPRRRWLPTPVIGVVSCVVLFGGTLAGPVGGGADQAVTLVFGAAVLGGSWTIGRAVRERRAYAARSARQLADRAVTDERLRIARELHDVVAHSMSLIAVKAGVAVHVADARPQEALDALRVIETTSRGTLAEMRHLLGVLREGSMPDAPDLAPVPDLSALPALAERAAMAGVRVDLDVRAPDLPESLAVSAYRIVQEAVTNVVKHAAPARCRVTVAADGGALRIHVADDGPGTRVLPGGPPPGAGHGLVGMRERVMMYGGDFSAGPGASGGFEVAATMPYETGATT